MAKFEFTERSKLNRFCGLCTELLKQKEAVICMGCYESAIREVQCGISDSYISYICRFYPWNFLYNSSKICQEEKPEKKETEGTKTNERRTEKN